MQKELYIALKARIETLASLKIVGLWNNQFERENENVPFGYPCVFIEFTNIEYRDFLKGVQDFQMDVSLHLGFESYKTEDIDILQLKQDLHFVVHTFQQGYNTKLLRRSEVQNFDHTNIQEYILTYHCSGKDYFVDTDVLATVNTLELDVELVQSENQFSFVRILENGWARLTQTNGLRLLQ